MLSESKILNDVIDSIEKQPDRIRKVAVLRCFARGLQRCPVDPKDEYLLDLPKDVLILPVNEA